MLYLQRDLSRTIVRQLSSERADMPVPTVSPHSNGRVQPNCTSKKIYAEIGIKSYTTLLILLRYLAKNSQILCERYTSFSD